MKNDSAPEPLAPMQTWLAEPMSAAVSDAVTRLRRAPDVVRLAIMPDAHLAEHVCIGVVLATRSLVYPQAVGGDIGCGISAVALDADADTLSEPERRWIALHTLQSAAPILRHRAARDAPALPAGLSPGSLSTSTLANAARRTAAIELGTLGRGNHFLEIQADDNDRLWLTVHSGSRGIGQAVKHHHLRGADRNPGGLPSLDTRADSGLAYMHDAAWAERFAEANRDALLDQACLRLHTALGVRADDALRFGSSHNHVRRERHAGEEFLVHRKGTNAAHSDLRAIIPGSMGDATFHVSGRGVAESLYSSSHGAGRALARSEAQRRISISRLRAELANVTFDPRLSRHLVEEAPSAYRGIGKVMRAQRDLVRIDRTLRTLVCHKGA